MSSPVNFSRDVGLPWLIMFPASEIGISSPPSVVPITCSPLVRLTSVPLASNLNWPARV
ncbi:hypothetical protein D3C87_2012530 [compost metagenome]